MSEFKLPDVGEGLTEAEIVTWRVAVGEEVAVNDVLVDIETAKSIVELPSPYAGTVSRLLVEEGTTVEVGTPIIDIGDSHRGGAGPADGDPLAETSEPEITRGRTEERQAVLVGYGPRAGGARRRRKRPLGTEQAVPPPATHETVVVDERPAAVRALAKPPVRKLAKDLGIDLTEVPAAGPVVTRAEVEAFAAAATSGPAPARVESSPAAEDVRIPVTGVRKTTAEAMVSSAFTAPHASEWVTVDVSRTMELVERLRADRAFADVKVSPTLIVAKAVCLALRRTPEMNAAFDAEAGEIVLKGAVNLGIAAATERGLVVPNIPGADRLSLPELAAALGALTATARAGKTQPAQMSGGTFTLTNIGVFGVDAGTPILHPGESGILALGSIERRPWVDDDDAIVSRWVTTLAVSFDHRVVDGQQGSAFLADVAAILRDPAWALTF